ncbi:HAMP domain-containing protein [Paenibacillus sp. LMG 31458]|uniref:HAMP domain-containing protein n=1 Tax=Paenibacillus phytorum TaxID=2654977 RepID=A0ABX1XQI7_9BACL|nr:sensor histidine kinase [Paenibacillus phytorum]NOU70664.1 HAMP domain-containing protein [Paenibacillus phytorum]
MPKFAIKTIQSKLFFTFSILIVSIVMLLATPFYYYIAHILKESASESAYQSASYISTQLDSQIESMDNTAVKVISSEKVRDLFFQNHDFIDTNVSLSIQRQINEIIYSIMGPLQLDWQINLFDTNGRFVGIGNNSFITSFGSKPEKLDWVNESLDRDGRKFVTAPHLDDWSSNGKEVISLTRMFPSEIGSNQRGIVEVQLNYETVKKLIAKLMAGPSESSFSKKSVYIYNEQGIVIYPVDSVSEDNAKLYWDTLQSQTNESDVYTFKNSVTNESELLAYFRSRYSKWTVVTVQSETLLLQPVKVFRNTIFAAVVGLLLITLIVSYFAARGLTSPIKQMHKSIRALSIDTLEPASQIESSVGVNELESLNNAFKKMCARLQSSIEETFVSRSKEMQARMLALQSQMNPHFLYNTITIISIMAEEKDQHDIVQMCRHLSRMLRYILSDKDNQVSLADEVGYAESYMTLMQSRYEDMIQFQVQIDPAILNENVPKLVVQPIIENCIKYAINVDPPWRIQLIGEVDGDRWRIRVLDNGGGFTSEALEALQEPKDPNRTDGMGLKNISERLRLLYGSQVEFSAFNLAEGGACVTIGGPMDIRNLKLIQRDGVSA